MRNKIIKITKTYECMLFITIVVLMAVFAVATGGKSITTENLLDVLISNSAYGIMAFGSLFVIISGGVDISFMAFGAVAQYVGAVFMLNVGGNFGLVVAIVLAVGALLGLINAVLVNRLKVPTLIITIATMNIVYGIMMRLTKGMRLSGFPKWFANKSPWMLFLLSAGFMLVVMIVSQFILKKTKMGRKIFAVGGNLEAARRSGINVFSVHLFVYGFAGATAALGALVKCYLSQQASISALYGNEMDVLAMVILGGVSLAGGKGTVLGTALGIFLVSMLSNSMILIGVSSYWKDLVIGAVILISFCITGYRINKQNRGSRKEALDA